MAVLPPPRAGDPGRPGATRATFGSPTGPAHHPDRASPRPGALLFADALAVALVALA
ncbi:MAG TPA: hypothetical protein VJ870_10315 [Amycolatopsis sp.]|nr:hypothetical protein [Amycolatopsis sp.]